MRLSPPLLALCLLLGACADAPPERRGFLGAEAARPAPSAAAVEVTITDIPPGHEVEQATLIDPAGGRHPAERLTPGLREGSTLGPGAVVGFGLSGGSSSGVRPALSLGLGTGVREQESRSRVVTARVPLAAPAAFRAEARRWRLEVVYRDVTGARRSLVLPVVPEAP